MRKIGVYLTSKPCQIQREYISMIFLGVPTTTETSSIKKLVDQVLKPLETELIQSDPINFTIVCH